MNYCTLMYYFRVQALRNLFMTYFKVVDSCTHTSGYTINLVDRFDFFGRLVLDGAK